MGPADALFAKLIPVIGRAPASMARVVVPRMLLILAAGYWAYYQLKYHPKDWTREGGFHIYTNKPMLLTNDTVIPEKKSEDYYNLGFKSRKVLLDGKTSGQV